jgi:transcription elongation factor Elf1
MNLPFEKDCNCSTKIAQGNGTAICKLCGEVWKYELNSGWKKIKIKTVKAN